VQKVEDDFESGIRSGVNGTPTFFINGVILRYDTTYQSLLSAVEMA
jgi:protein-disulfide isomerase